MQIEKMENLWKKEVTPAGDRYVDYFPLRTDLADLFFNMSSSPASHKDNDYSKALRLKGNDSYQMQDWVSAMIAYNQSLRYAEIGSTNVAMGYTNRSACFFNMEMYAEALIDVELAEKANVPARLVPMLQQRKQESQKLLNTVVRPPIPVRNLSYKANDQYPCLADVVEIKYDQEFGRHLVAKCDIPVGKIILLEENFVKSESVENLECKFCFDVIKNSIACSDCADVEFCSADCMNRDQFHKWVCGTPYHKFEGELRFFIKLVVVAIETFGSVENLMDFVETALAEAPEHLPSSMLDAKSKYHFFFKLKTSAKCPDYRVDKWNITYNGIMRIPKLKASFDSDEKKHFLKHLIAHHFLILYTNGHHRSVDVSMYNMLSLLNHSCAPNLFNGTFDGKQCGITGRPIKKGEQLFITYLVSDNQLTTSQRQANLTKWGFECKCDKCQPMQKPIDSAQIRSDPCYRFVLENSRYQLESKAVIDKCIQFLNKYGHTTWNSEIETISKIYRSTFRQPA